MPGPGTIPVDNEKVAWASRKTRDDRTLHYRLEVLQSPDRARACGSGAKSQTDRRPVDPPPIVSLKILQGEGDVDQLKDITFTMDATYMLYVSLQHARFQASCRGSQSRDSKTAIMHCAGQAVSGLTLLERPEPAGYFLFPDLSVRHEGSYRLNFSLFEIVKHAHDEEHDQSDTPSGRESAVHRLDVRSEAFTVYSAKKFPGLMLSTELTRDIADQGCRIRIRRDVRMRKRNTEKSGKDIGPYEGEPFEAFGRVSATPELSGSHAMAYADGGTRPPSSATSRHPSLAPLSRRTSFQALSPALQPSFGILPQRPMPHTYPHEAQTYPAYSQQQAYSPIAQPHLPPYTAINGQHALPAPAPPASSYGYGPPPPLPPPLEPFSYHRRSSIDYNAPMSQRQPSLPYSPIMQSPQPSYMTYQPAPSHPPAYSAPHVHRSSFSSADGYNRPLPAEPVQPPIRAPGITTPLPSRPFDDKKLPLPPLNTTYASSTTKYMEPSSPAGPLLSQQPHSPYPTPNSGSTPLDSHKRSYNQVFSERHLSEPMRQGARPTPATYSTGSTNPSSFPVLSSSEEDAPVPADGGFNIDGIEMSYRRADGRHVVRRLPQQG